MDAHLLKNISFLLVFGRCTEWGLGLGLGGAGADMNNRAAVFRTLRLRPVAVAGAEAGGRSQ